MNDVRLRLLALERGESITNPPTLDEIKEALLARIAPRGAAIEQTTRKVSKKRAASRAASKPTPADDLGDEYLL